MRRILPLSVMLIALLGPGDLMAQGASAPCSGPEYHQFDFFAGDWLATRPDGKPAGTNLVSTELGGCLLLEHWEGAGGTNGQSMNFFDRNDQKWHQVWVDNEGNWLDLVGQLNGRSMEFLATTTGPGGKPQQIRAAFVDNGDTTVREHYESSMDDGKTWKPEFDATFARRKNSVAESSKGRTVCGEGEYRQFDFWVGEWTVLTPQGQPAGASSITLEEDGCLIHEHYDGSSAGGGLGQSLNFYDRNDHRWHQMFVGAAGNALHLSGTFSGGKMVLTGHNVRGGKPAVQRITWSREGGGVVRQLWETSLDGGKTWSTSFDGKYVRSKK